MKRIIVLKMCFALQRTNNEITMHCHEKNYRIHQSRSQVTRKAKIGDFLWINIQKKEPSKKQLKHSAVRKESCCPIEKKDIESRWKKVLLYDRCVHYLLITQIDLKIKSETKTFVTQSLSENGNSRCSVTASSVGFEIITAPPRIFVYKEFQHDTCKFFALVFS